MKVYVLIERSITNKGYDKIIDVFFKRKDAEEYDRTKKRIDRLYEVEEHEVK